MAATLMRETYRFGPRGSLKMRLVWDGDGTSLANLLDAEFLVDGEWEPGHRARALELLGDGEMERES